MSRASNKQDYDFGPFEDDYRGFGPGDGETARGPLILALVAGVVLIFGAVIWNTYKQGVRSEAGALPIIYADASPYKRAPDNPGGVTAPDQERRIYDQIDGSDRAVTTASAGAAAQNAASENDGGQGELLQGGPPIELRPGEETDLDEATGIPRAALPQVAALADLDNLPDTAPVAASAASVAPKPEPSLTLPSSKFAFNTSGDFLVQIAALRTQEAADAAWGGAVGANPGMFTGAEKRIQRADLGAKGVFYRLRVGAFAQRTEASEFCDALKARGETCIVVSG